MASFDCRTFKVRILILLQMSASTDNYMSMFLVLQKRAHTPSANVYLHSVFKLGIRRYGFLAVLYDGPRRPLLWTRDDPTEHQIWCGHTN